MANRIPSQTQERCPQVLQVILDLPPTPGGLVDLAADSKIWLVEEWTGPADANPLLDPDVCTQFVSWLHERHSIQWSYGGYLEDRTELWRGSYLSPSGQILHAGVDVNVPAGTQVRAAIEGTVVVAESDFPLVGGWGAHVIIEPSRPSAWVLLFGHLEDLTVSVGQKVQADTAIGLIGKSPQNGFWFPHLHFQAIRSECFHGKYQSLTRLMDGYFPISQTEQYQWEFPEPLAVLQELHLQVNR